LLGISLTLSIFQVRKMSPMCSQKLLPNKQCLGLIWNLLVRKPLSGKPPPNIESGTEERKHQDKGKETDTEALLDTKNRQTEQLVPDKSDL
jgi:hypothetical protein